MPSTNLQFGNSVAVSGDTVVVGNQTDGDPTTCLYCGAAYVWVRSGPGSWSPQTKLVLPSVQYRDAELNAVLDALRQQISKATDGKQAINFVMQLPPEQAKTSISLSLTNIPATEVLKYIGALANVSFTYDKYAIIVRPASPTAATEPQASK